MKSERGITKYLSVIILLIIAASGRLYAQSIHITQGENLTEILQNDYSVFAVQNSVAAIHASKIKTEDQNFIRLDVEGYGFSNHIGEPQLPVLKKLIEIPLGADLEIFFTYKSYKDLSLSDFNLHDYILPVQPSLSKSQDPAQAEFQFREDVYNIDDFLGDDLVSVTPLGIMRGVSIARLEISPVQYNPVSNVLRVHNDIAVEIRFIGGDISQTIVMKEDGMNPFFSGIGKMLFNYKKPESADNLFDRDPITYIIVSDPMFQEALQPFIAWKSKKGFRVVEAYTDNPQVGNSTISIKTYLKTFYENPPDGYQPQSFILIVGDVAQVPAFNGTTGNHVTDLYYAEYTGDKFPEAYYGRFSAVNIAQLQSQIDKTLEYEQYLFPDPTFLDEVVMVAGEDASHQMIWGNGQINYGTNYYFNENNGLFSHTYLQPEPAGGNYSIQIRQNVSDGVAYANYTAHCSASGWSKPAFTINHISALQNQSKYPLMVGNCCSSVAFGGNSFGEDIMRAEGKGAIGYVGGSNNTYWDEDFHWAVGFTTITANPVYDPSSLGAYDRLFHNKEGVTIDDWHVTQGQMPTAGNLAVTQSGSSLTNYYWEIYHLMGDPSLMVYFSQPPDISANYPSLIPLGVVGITINTEPFAYLAISKDEMLTGAGFANLDGVAEITFFENIETPGIAEIVITGQNKKPYFGEILVGVPDEPYVLLQQAAVNDQSHGNGNGLMEYAETINLNITMQNFGQEPGENIILKLITTDLYATITDSLVNLGNIEPNGLISLTGVFEISLSEALPEGYHVSFRIEATDGTDVWKSNFTIKGHAPVLEIAGFMVSDPDGNNNGQFDPGETVQLSVFTKNTGSSAAFDLEGVLHCNNPYITVLTAHPQPFGEIAPQQIVSAVFEVTADEHTPAGYLAAFMLDLSAAMGITASGQFDVTVGLIPVLIVDLDGNKNSGDTIKAAVTQLGLFSEKMNGFPDNLSLYSSVFVCLGVYNHNYTLTQAQGQLLADYLNAGGRLYMEGGDTWFYDPATPVHEMFGIIGVADGSGDLSTISGDENSFCAGLSFQYNGDNNWIDRLEPTNGAKVVFTNQPPEYHCAISRIGNGYKTIGSSFEFGGVNPDSTRLEVMQKYLEYFDITMPASLECNLYALVDDICQRDTTQMIIEISGGSGYFRYQWTPQTGLDDPTAFNPKAFPEISTLYTVEIVDLLTGHQIIEKLMINVRPKPLTPEISQDVLSLVSSAAEGNQWYNDDGLIQGATGQRYTPQKTSNYYTIVTNAYSCPSDTSNIIHFQSTFIDELIAVGSLRVYPNPTSGVVHIDFITESGEAPSFQVFNAFGQMMNKYIDVSLKRFGANTITYDISGLPGGVYYFKFQDMNNVAGKKIILSK